LYLYSSWTLLSLFLLLIATQTYSGSDIFCTRILEEYQSRNYSKLNLFWSKIPPNHAARLGIGLWLVILTFQLANIVELNLSTITQDHVEIRILKIYSLILTVSVLNLRKSFKLNLEKISQFWLMVTISLLVSTVPLFLQSSNSFLIKLSAYITCNLLVFTTCILATSKIIRVTYAKDTLRLLEKENVRKQFFEKTL
jgi:hypothetical protein